MQKRFLLLGLSLLLWCVAPQQICAQTDGDSPATEVSAVGITMSGSSTVHITNAEGLVLQVYNIIGRAVETHRIESTDQLIKLSQPRGCYMLKVGKVVRKISIR